MNGASISSYQWINNEASWSYQWIINEKSSSYQSSINIILPMDYHTRNGSSINNHHPVNEALTSSYQWIINEASSSYYPINGASITSCQLIIIILLMDRQWTFSNIILPMDHHLSIQYHFSRHIKSSSIVSKLTEADVRTFAEYDKAYNFSI